MFESLPAHHILSPVGIPAKEAVRIRKRGRAIPENQFGHLEKVIKREVRTGKAHNKVKAYSLLTSGKTDVRNHVRAFPKRALDDRRILR